MSQDGIIPTGTWKTESELENRGQAVILSGEMPTDLQIPSISRMKPGESIWKPGEYLLESELMKFACEHRQVKMDENCPKITGSELLRFDLKIIRIQPENCAANSTNIFLAFLRENGFSILGFSGQ